MAADKSEKERAREERVARALRDNLKRRKERARALDADRRPEVSPESHSGDGPTGPDTESP